MGMHKRNCLLEANIFQLNMRIYYLYNIEMVAL